MAKIKRLAIMTVFVLLTNIILPSVGAYANVENGELIQDEVMNTLQGNENEALEEKEEMEEVEDSLDQSSKVDEIKEEVTGKKEEITSEEVVDEAENNEDEAAVYAEDVMLSNLENPITTHKLTGDFYLKGWAISKNSIQNVEVYLDGKKVGDANYGLVRNDIGGKYYSYPNSSTSGFDYKFKGISNGSHTVKVVITDTKSNKTEHSADITVDNTRTLIMGTGSLTKEQMVKTLYSNNPKKSLSYISNFVDITIKEAKVEGVNHDVLFSQMMHETGYLKFGGDVKEEQNNFAGLGATGNGVPGESFGSIEVGIRAVVQHLKAYASTEPLKQDLVDTRFQYVARGSALYVEHLGIKENPEGKGWAAAKAYGYSVLSLRDKAASMSKDRDFSILTDVKVSGKAMTGYPMTVEGVSDPAGNTLYKIWACNRTTNEWILLSDYSTKNKVTYTPTKPGNYDFIVYTKHVNSKLADDDYVTKSVNIQIGVSTISNFNIEGDAIINSELTLKASATPSEYSLYRFYVCDRSTNKWTMLSDYSTTNSVKFTPTKVGKYSLVVYTKHSQSSKNVEDDYKSIDIEVTSPKSTLKSFNVTGDKLVGSTLTLAAEGTPSADTLYRFYVCDRSTNTWTMISDYSATKSVTFTPKKAGRYSLVAYVKHKNNGKDIEDAYKSIDIDVTGLNSTLKSFNITGDKLVGSTLTLSAEGTPAADTLYRFYVCDRSTNTWTILSDYSATKSVTFTPTKAGRYSLVAYVKHKNNGKDSEDAYKSIDIDVTGLKSTLKSFNVTGDKIVGSTLTLAAEGTPTTDTLYRFYVCDRSTNTWTMLSDYSDTKSVTFTPTKAGRYSLVAYVKHKKNGKDIEDAYKSIDIDVTGLKSTLKSFNVTGDKLVGSTLTLAAEGTPTADTQYRFYVCDRSTNTWTMLSDYSATKSVTFTPKKAGKYSLVAYVKHKNNGKNSEDDYKSIDIEVTGLKSTLKSFNVTGDNFVGRTLTLAAEGTPAEDTLYRFYVCDRSTNTWTMLSDYSSTKSVTFTPKKAGKYSLVAYVKHKNNGKDSEDAYKSIDLQITEIKSTLKSFEVTGNKYVNHTLKLSAKGTPQNDTLYKLWVCDRSTNKWTVLSDYSSLDSIEFTPTKPGKYTFTAHVKHKESANKDEDDYKSIDVDITLPVSKATSLQVGGDLKLNQPFTITAAGTPANDTLYKIWVCDRNTNEWIVLSDYSSNNKATFTPKEYGTYSVVVHVKNKYSTNVDEDDYISKDVYIRNKLIVIDPGHSNGGDGGAYRSHNGVVYDETVLNMQVAQKLKTELVNKGYQVVVTREYSNLDNLTMRQSLQKRVEIANSLNADLFISIHHNATASYVSSANGIEAYYSSATPGTRGVLLSNGIEDVPEENRNLFETRNTSKVTQSSNLAKSIVNEVSSQMGYKNRGAIDDDFYVVKNTTMPSILFENGFICNPTEAAKIANPTNQAKTAKIIAECVEKQFK